MTRDLRRIVYFFRGLSGTCWLVNGYSSHPVTLNLNVLLLLYVATVLSIIVMIAFFLVIELDNYLHE